MTTTTALIIGLLTIVICTLVIFAISWGVGTAEKDFEKNDEYE